MLDVNRTALILIDVQEKLVTAMHERETLLQNVHKLVDGAIILGVPVIHSEQYPKGLGPTVPEIAALLAPAPPVEKLSFGCCGEPRFNAALAPLDRTDLLVAGIEAHVCVYQTVAQLLDTGRRIHVVADAVTSRTPANRDLALAKMSAMGAQLTSVEMCLFELLRTAEAPTFKAISKLVR